MWTSSQNTDIKSEGLYIEVEVSASYVPRVEVWCEAWGWDMAFWGSCLVRF
jgi:hypothetical protein